MTREGNYLTPRQSRRIARAVSKIERSGGGGSSISFGRDVAPTMAFADEEILPQSTGLSTFSADDYFSPVRGQQQVTVYNLTNAVVDLDQCISIEYYTLENAGGAWVHRVASPNTKAGCPRDPMWLGQGFASNVTATDTIAGGAGSTEITIIDDTSLYPSFLTTDNQVLASGTRWFTPGGVYYELEATISFEVFSTTADSLEVYAQFGGSTDRFPPFKRSYMTFVPDGAGQIGPFARGSLVVSGVIPPSPPIEFYLSISIGITGSGSATLSSIDAHDIVIRRLINCTQAESPPSPVGPGDLCNLTTLAYFWQSEQNYVVASTNVWSVSDAACTSGITFERAVATAPTNLTTINSIIVLDFDGTQLLDMVGATNLAVDNSSTLKEIWIGWNHRRKSSTLVEYVLRGDSGGIDGIGRNEYGYLQIEMGNVETEFGKLCLADGLPHVLRIEVTAANTYRLTLDNFYSQTIDTTNDIAIDGIGQAQGATLDFDGQLMDLYFSEAIADEDAATVWDYLMGRISAAAEYYTVPDGSDSILNDQFLVADAAPVTTPRTCEPGPGTLTWDTGDEAFYGIAGQQLQLSGSGTTSLTRKFSGGAQTRQLGLRMEAHCEMTDATQAVCFIGWMNSQSGDTNTIQGGFYFSNDINSHLGYASYMGVTITEEFEGYHVGFETDVFVSVVLRAAGFHVFASFCGQLKHIVASVLNSSATVYPGMINANGNFALDFFRVRGSTYIPTPICSDSFTRGDSSSIGSTDDAGAEETGGQTLSWTETAVASGDAEILSNRLSNQQTTAGDNVFCTVESSVADITMEATLFLSDWAAVVFNWQDASNYWLGIMNATDGAGNGLPGSSGAGHLELYEVISGTATRRGFANTATINKGDDIYIWAHCDDDTCRVEIVEVTATATSYAASYTVNDRPLKSETKHGVYLDNKVGATAAECSRFVLWKRNVTDYV